MPGTAPVDIVTPVDTVTSAEDIKWKFEYDYDHKGASVEGKEAVKQLELVFEKEGIKETDTLYKKVAKIEASLNELKKLVTDIWILTSSPKRHILKG